MNDHFSGTVTFIGAGPGDPQLLTIKGQQALACADVVIYAGSLVSEEILQFAVPHAAVYSSAGMKLEELTAIMVTAAKQGKRVVRLHTGDPSIYGAIHEQIQILNAEAVPYQIIPGVSSAFAAAAALGIEYTLPEIGQTVILTRQSGRTAVPAAENLQSLASHHASLVIFLSTGLLHEVVNDLRAADYPPDTPVALVYRASWPDERILRGTLENIAALAEHEELTHQSLIIVSPALNQAFQTASHLYGGFQETVKPRKGVAILALTAPAVHMGRKLLGSLPNAELYLPARLRCAQDENQPNIQFFQESIRQVLQSAFTTYESLVCIMASGIVMRELAPLLKNKHSDPAVIVMDSSGQFVVSLLSGHEGGANQLARQIADLTGGQAVITTASDQMGIPALDILAQKQGWQLHPSSHLANIMAALVNQEPVNLVIDPDLSAPAEILDFSWKAQFADWKATLVGENSPLVMLTCRDLPEAFWQTAPPAVVYHLPVLTVGLGCNRGTSPEEIIAAIQTTLEKAGLALASVACIATIEQKANETGLLEACRQMNWKLAVFTSEEVRQIDSLPNPSEHARRALGVEGVAEPSALLAATASRLLVEKQKFPNVTVAVAMLQEAQ